MIHVTQFFAADVPFLQLDAGQLEDLNRPLDPVLDLGHGPLDRIVRNVEPLLVALEFFVTHPPERRLSSVARRFGSRLRCSIKEDGETEMKLNCSKSRFFIEKLNDLKELTTQQYEANLPAGLLL